MSAVHLFCLFPYICCRPYHVECTGSLPTSEVKRHRARLVLGWGDRLGRPQGAASSADQTGEGQRGKGKEEEEEEEGEGGGGGEGEGEEAEEEAEAIWPPASSSASPLKLP